MLARLPRTAQPSFTPYFSRVSSRSSRPSPGASGRAMKPSTIGGRSRNSSNHSGSRRGIRERLQDEPGGAGGHRMDVDLRIVMRGQRHLVQLGHHRGLAPGGQPAGPGRVDDQVVDQPLGDHRAQAERAVLRLAGRDGDVDRVLQPRQSVALVVPGHRIFQPEDVVGRAQLRRAHGGGQSPSPGWRRA